ncbi:MAG: stage V sporulation protein SpoVM [Clostridia bacterium]|nr:stage V sporulation protein SpoVM [Clostridia bacterium]
MKGLTLMKIVLFRSPAFLAPILRKFFGIKKK